MSNLFKYLVAVILVAIPLYPKFPLISIPGTFVSVRLEDLLLFLAACILTLYIFKNDFAEKIFRISFNKAVLFYLIIGFVSLLSAMFITKTINPTIGSLHLIRRIEYFVPFYLGLYSIHLNKANLRFYSNILVIVVFATFIYGLGQKYYSWPIIITQNEEYSKGAALRYVPGGHINSTFAGHYDLSTFLIMTLPLFIAIFSYFKDKIRYVYALGFVCGLWLLVNSASRVSLVSYLVSSLFVLILIRRKVFIPVILIFTLFFAGASDNLVARYKRIIEVSVQKVNQFNLLNYVVVETNAQGSNLPEKIVLTPTPTSIPVFEDRSSNIRLNVEWPRAIRALSKNPLLGTGYSSITLATDNDYLRALGEVGILGFVGFALVLLQLVLLFIKKFPLSKVFSDIESIYVYSMFAGIPGVLLNAMFIDVFEASKFAIMFWLMMGIAVGILTHNEKHVV